MLSFWLKHCLLHFLLFLKFCPIDIWKMALVAQIHELLLSIPDWVLDLFLHNLLFVKLLFFHCLWSLFVFWLNLVSQNVGIQINLLFLLLVLLLLKILKSLCLLLYDMFPVNLRLRLVNRKWINGIVCFHHCGEGRFWSSLSRMFKH